MNTNEFGFSSELKMVSFYANNGERMVRIDYTMTKERDYQVQSFQYADIKNENIFPFIQKRNSQILIHLFTIIAYKYPDFFNTI